MAQDGYDELRIRAPPYLGLVGGTRNAREKESSLSNLLRGVVYEYIVTPGRVGRKTTVTLRLSSKYRFLAQGARDGRWIHKLSSGGWVRRGDIKVDMWMPGNECRPVRIVTY